jgi:acetyl esterase/lipase
MPLRNLPRALALLLLFSVSASYTTFAEQHPPETVLLWPAGAPGALGNAPSDQPRLTLFPAPHIAGHDTHTAVLVLPGGGYEHLATSYEGADIARWLNNLGVSAFMLEYRLGPRYHHPIELGDAARAMRWVRQHAAQYGYDPHRIGVWGFSAGGHLAATLGTHYDSGNPSAADPLDRIDDKPDFLILAYPVIDPLGSAAKLSFTNLLGEHPDPRLVDDMSLDHRVTPQTPPTFLVAASDDPIVDPECSVNFYTALRHAGVPAELHIYAEGGHGFGLAQFNPILSSWTTRLADWLRTRGMLNTN